MIRLVVVGAAGRMGRAVTLAAAAAADVELAALVDVRRPAGEPGPWSDSAEQAIQPGTVVIEFTGPAGAVEVARACAARGVALVSGSTGLDAGQDAALRAAGERVALLRASNFSIGIAALRRALAATLAALPSGWDVEIVERHHRLKKDSPSGTALTLADDVLAARGATRSALRHGREGAVGARSAGEVGVHAVRGGTWVGDHAVLLAGEGESLELRHVAQDRSAFAHGALAAARFVAKAGPGIYALDDLFR